MKLVNKISALFRSRFLLTPRSRPHPERAPAHRPNPPAGNTPLLNQLVEQLALEAYLNGEGFAFRDDELEARLLDFADRLVAAGELAERPSGWPPGWIDAQQAFIRQLAAWWRAHGGPDIQPQVL
ncbi:MAG: hypothetical protein KKA73_11430 [Chloroflexi bacterium]|nr:hypothetical protein [Chloroflexota bacterium]